MLGVLMSIKTVLNGAVDLPLSWKVESGEWRIEGGSLETEQPGLVVLQQRPGVRFEVEFEMNYRGGVTFFLDQDQQNVFRVLSYHPSNRSKEDGIFYLSEVDAKSGEIFVDKHVKTDSDFRPDVFHKVRARYDCSGIAVYFNGNLKETAQFRIDPDPRLAIDFKPVEKGDYLKIRNFTVTPLEDDKNAVLSLVSKNYETAQLFAAHGREIRTAPKERLDTSGEGVAIKYAFGTGREFEGGFARIPAEVAQCARIWIEVEGDGSGNLFFLTVIDRDGEHHLVAEIPLRWEGWRKVGVNLGPFLELRKERTRKHWGGNENQRLDFPVTALDVGVARQNSRTRDVGTVHFRNIRFVN